MQVLEPIDLRARFGAKPDWDHASDYVTSVMQVGLSKLASRTVLPMVR
ncbi:phospholipid/glycerol acyltransferase [Mycobacterium tuberculosis]|nr:phospholipid/glycerol acyltransferase [Mycobacterium tuberculosis]